MVYLIKVDKILTPLFGFCKIEVPDSNTTKIGMQLKTETVKSPLIQFHISFCNED